MICAEGHMCSLHRGLPEGASSPLLLPEQQQLLQEAFQACHRALLSLFSPGYKMGITYLLEILAGLCVQGFPQAWHTVGAQCVLTWGSWIQMCVSSVVANPVGGTPQGRVGLWWGWKAREGTDVSFQKSPVSAPRKAAAS